MDSGLRIDGLSTGSIVRSQTGQAAGAVVDVSAVGTLTYTGVAADGGVTVERDRSRSSQHSLCPELTRTLRHGACLNDDRGTHTTIGEIINIFLDI